MAAYRDPNKARHTVVDRASRRWLQGWSAAAVAFVGLTFLAEAAPGPWSPMLDAANLGSESNLAAWFSAASLLWAGLLLGSAAAGLGRRDVPAAAAAGFTGLIALALGVDEAGSLHERFSQLAPAGFPLSREGVAALGAIPVVVALTVLFARRNAFGNVWLLQAAAFVLFGTVIVQERLEHTMAWPTALLPLRIAVEEGTELVGMFLLLRAGAALNARCGSADPLGPPPPALLPARGVAVAVVAAAALLTPPLVLGSLSIPLAELSLANRGDFASTMPLAGFLAAAAIAAVEAKRARTRPDAPTGWLGVAVGCFLLSLLQCWDAHADVFQLFTERMSPLSWRACVDLLWALPVVGWLGLRVRPRPPLTVWLTVALAVLWLVSLLATMRGGFRLSYLASWQALLAVGAWVVVATRRR